MEIKLNEKEKRDILHAAFCNAGHLWYGDMDIYYHTKKDEKPDIPKEIICREDKWLYWLEQGNNLNINDNGTGEQFLFSLREAYSAIEKLPTRIILYFIEEQDDAETADWVLEYICFGEKIYG